MRESYAQREGGQPALYQTHSHRIACRINRRAAMAERKAVLFNFWGVLVPSVPGSVCCRLEEQLGLSGGFLSSVLSLTDGVMMRAERGDVALTQMIPEFQAECVKEAEVRGVKLPSDWSVSTLLEEFRKAMLDIRDTVLKTAASLRHNGHRVPGSAMFSSALEQLGVTPKQAVWLDVDQEGVKAAEGTGMKAILVENLEAALEKLSDFTGVPAVGAVSRPLSCTPDQVSHGYISIKPGVRIHYVEMGSGPPVLLCHGFPESWYSWRYQIPALAAAGFRVLALDMKGYGESTAPPDIEEYSQEQICKDLITFLDKMAIPQVTLVGHDWGGMVVWNLARYFPERIRAVASLNTPLFSSDPTVPPLAKIKAIPIFDYQIYFQTPGVAESELEKDLERSFKIFFYSSSEKGKHPILSTAGVCARGGLFVGLPEQIPMSCMLTEADLQYYVSQYREKGFRGPLNWYRNMEANWKWTCSQHNGKILMPALMVTAGKDPVLLPALSNKMEDLIPNLSRGHIEESGHWTQMDKPAETNNILISWLIETHKKAGGVAMAPKL
ncbi:bifunctional epoxide hydrolase 2 isoform X3 [Nothobranchius furzeri]|uniref:bifunctional epoxide hydrolase 2 isoform X3 n=1 Tax=Nothobranchius furzeri TaxID=105023 RepID=UPI00390478A9